MLKSVLQFCGGIGLSILMFGCQTMDLSQLNETFYVRHDGADMPAYVHGNGSDKVFLLVLHGAASYGLAFRDGAFTEDLESRYAVVYYDQRGQSMAQGRYEQPEDIVAQMAEDVVALVAVMKEKYGEDIRIFLMGHSWGGALSGAVLVKGQQQELFAGWINVDGAHDFPFSASARRSMLLSLSQTQIDAGNSITDWTLLQDRVTELDSVNEEDHSAMLEEVKTANELLINDGIIAGTISGEKLQRAIIENNPITWFVSNLLNQPFQEAIDMEFSITEQLSSINIPTLIIFGNYDTSVPPTLGADAFSRLGSQDKSLVIFEASGHHPHDTEPELFAEKVIEFIDRVK